MFAMLPIVIFTPLARKMVTKYGKKELSIVGSISDDDFRKDPESMDAKELGKLAKELEKKMRQAAAELNFEEAAKLRDRMKEVKIMLLELEG